MSIDYADEINIEKFSLGKGSISEKKERLDLCVKNIIADGKQQKAFKDLEKRIKRKRKQ